MMALIGGLLIGIGLVGMWGLDPPPGRCTVAMCACYVAAIVGGSLIGVALAHEVIAWL